MRWPVSKRKKLLKRRRSISMEDELWERLQGEADERGYSVSFLICRAAKKYVRQLEEIKRLREANDERAS